jgi:succinate dehydrogenase/fumarate reductase cytochrome b subunit
MQVTEEGAAFNAEQVAHARPAVERWLSWSGLVPLPAFLCLHLGRELCLAFAGDVSEVLRPAPSAFTLATSWLLVWLPLLVHGALGLYLLLVGQRLAPLPGRDVTRSSRLVSRIGALLALLFVLFHARTYTLSVWLAEADGRDAGFRLLAELSSTHWGVPLTSGAYLVGLLATVAHAALGIHGGLARAGLLTTAVGRQRSARACAAFGVLLFGIGAMAVIRVASGVLLR